MSKGGKQKTSTTQTTTLDPQLQQTLYGNVARAQQLAGRAYNPLSGSQISQYENPYMQQVIDPTMADLNRSREMTLNDNAAKAVAANAFGGSRHGVLDAMTNSEFDRNTAGILGQLRAGGYAQALQTAQHENQSSNQYPILLQQLLNQSVGLIPQYGTTSGTSFTKYKQPMDIGGILGGLGSLAQGGAALIAL